jgi:hypothetical protein
MPLRYRLEGDPFPCPVCGDVVEAGGQVIEHDGRRCCSWYCAAGGGPMAELARSHRATQNLGQVSDNLFDGVG